MKEINIARAIVSRRKEKGITQDELASYIGVSKASVSKWETGQSYPDITFLPQLAAFFNISIDELMGYEPQMTREDIRKEYYRLSSDFASKPFDEVLEHCHEIIKKYYSCFPLLFQIGALLLNYSAVPGDAERTMAVINEAKELFCRVRKECDDKELSNQALNMEAGCCITLGRPDEAIELLEGIGEQLSSVEMLLASAYQMTGRLKDAKTKLQVGVYEHLGSLVGILTSYLMMNIDDAQQFEEIYKRELELTNTFKIKTLHPSILMNFYIAAAYGFAALENKDEAIKRLEEYTDLVTGDIYPLKLKGDDFFYLLDNWLESTILYIDAPRDESVIRRSMYEAVAKNPAFVSLFEEQRFQHIVEKLKNNC